MIRGLAVIVCPLPLADPGVLPLEHVVAPNLWQHPMLNVIQSMFIVIQYC